MAAPGAPPAAVKSLSRASVYFLYRIAKATCGGVRHMTPPPGAGQYARAIMAVPGAPPAVKSHAHTTLYIALT